MALEGFAPDSEPSVKTSRIFPSLEWSLAPVHDSKSGYVEDMALVRKALIDLGATIGGVHRQPILYTHWLELLDTEKPDIAIVNPAFFLLGTVIKECLARGIHVLAEKPIAISRTELEEIRKMTEAAKAPKLIATLTMRHDPAFVAAQNFLVAGSLGLPLMLKVQKSYPLIGWDRKPRPSFYYKRATYGGTIPWVGIHAIDIMRWFLRAEFRQVSANCSTAGNRGHGELESFASLDFKLKNGTLASAQLDFLKPNIQKVQKVDKASEPVAWGDDRLRVVCENGILEIQDGRVSVQTEGAHGFELEAQPVSGMFPDFLDWVLDHKPMRLSTQDCFAAAEASLLARDAADQGRMIFF